MHSRNAYQFYNTAGGRRVGGKRHHRQAQSMYTGTMAQGQMLQLSPLHHLPIIATWNAGAPNTEHPPCRALGVSSRAPTPLTRPLTTQLLHSPSLGSRWSFLPLYERLHLLDMFSKSRGKFATRRTRKPESAGSLCPQFLCTILFLTLINPFPGISCFNNTVA